ncbi:MAG: GNAT family N-acetyltransferase [Verrucomicrobia bacterium]|nr:GNAT family N-acetyltransferase [Verrucomicrobiota bacterium]
MLQWANDQETRFFSCDPSLINERQHIKWFKDTFRSRNINPALICMLNDRSPLGVIRFTQALKETREWEIHFTLSPKHRGQGFAKPMLEEALRWFFRKKQNQAVFARVMVSNLKSLKVLQSMGFRKKRSPQTASNFVHLLLPTRHKKNGRSPSRKT